MNADMLKALAEMGAGAELLPNHNPDLTKPLLDKLLVQHNFAVGDLVQWKPGLKNRRFPDEGVPMIVTRVEKGRTSSETNTGRDDWDEPLELSIGCIVPEGYLAEYAADARRFEPYTPPATSTPS